MDAMITREDSKQQRCCSDVPITREQQHQQQQLRRKQRRTYAYKWFKWTVEVPDEKHTNAFSFVGLTKFKASKEVVETLETKSTEDRIAYDTRMRRLMKKRIGEYICLTLLPKHKNLKQDCIIELHPGCFTKIGTSGSFSIDFTVIHKWEEYTLRDFWDEAVEICEKVSEYIYNQYEHFSYEMQSRKGTGTR